jgi:hypothetical protein
MAGFLACSLSVGPLIGISHHVASKTDGRVRVRLQWVDELHWSHADDGGPPYKATTLGTASVRIAAPGIATQTLALRPLLGSGHMFSMVQGKSDGCGATTNLALIPGDDPLYPDVVAFVVLDEKGCMPIPIVFVPLRGPHNRYAYVGAPYYNVWPANDKTRTPSSGSAQVASTHMLRLPHAVMFGMNAPWEVTVVRNSMRSGPAVLTLEDGLRDQKTVLSPGTRFMLGSYYDAWVIR